jgi:hypothetical protein
MNSVYANSLINFGCNRAWRALVVGGFLLLPGVLAFASHSVFVTIPFHSEEALTWCGPAMGQMVMGGYPVSACTLEQADVAASIQAHKVEGNWDTDPDGLRGAMMALCPPPPSVPEGGHWAVIPRPDTASLMYWVAYWMTKNQFPVALLLGTTAHNSYLPHQEHWVAVKGIITDLDPTAGNSTVNLQYINFVDPSPPNFGAPAIEFFLSAAQLSTVFAAVTKSSSKYKGEFVAVIEPPVAEGRALMPQRVLTGTIIPIAQATRHARAAVENLRLASMESFRDFAEARPLDPLLVNREHGAYYLVPFAVGNKAPALAVLINAYDGEFLEAAHFASHAYLPEKAAVERLRTAMRLPATEYKAALVSSPDAVEQLFPQWQVTTGGRTLRVSQRGAVRELPVQRPQ